MKRSLLMRGAALSFITCGLVTTATFAQNDVEYAYDDLGRISAVCYTATADLITYQYDKAGNRSAVSSSANACGPAYFSIADPAAITEGGMLSFTVSRSGNTSAVSSVDYASADGTATAASDYTALTSGTLSFATGETSKSIPVQTASDTLFEMAETMFVDLSNPSNGASIIDGQAVGTINNDDALSGVNFLISDASIAEGGVITFTVTKSGTTSLTHAVNFATANGTATAADYTAASGTLTFAPSEASKTVSVTTLDDTVYEGNETILVDLSNATSGAAIADSQGVGTINENEAAPSFTINNVNVAEGGTLNYTVTKTGSTALPHAVSYATANGTAVAGSDYTSKSGSLSFATADTSKTISVATTGDGVYELNETVLVNLSNPTNGAVISDSQGSGSINNNDAAPTFAVNNVSAVAGNNLSFKITKTGSTALSHTVSFATANGTAVAGTHYNAQSGGRTFTSSQTSKTINVSTISGSVTGSNKKMYLNLSNSTGGATISDSQGAGTIKPPPNNPPNAVGDTKSGSFEVFTAVSVFVLNNDSDPDGNPLTVTSASCISSQCQVSVVNGSYIRITGLSTGAKSATYWISDGRGGTDSATATVNGFESSCGVFC